MSQSDDPFSNNGRTVIRPRPGGVSSPFDNSPGHSPFGETHGPGSAQGTAPWNSSNQPSTIPGMGTPEDWIFGEQQKTGRAAVAPPTRRRVPLHVALNSRTGAEIKASNPIAQAATPLLILLGRLRQQVVEMDAMPLMQHVGATILRFEKTLLAQGIAPDQVQMAKYALCATADDIVQNLPGPDNHVWLQYSMLAQFFHDRTSGIGFFDQIRQLSKHPAVYFDLLELIHACLSLGFEGQYRSMAGGDIELQRVRRDVYQTLRHVKPGGASELSPRWRGMDLKLGRFREGVPLWTIAVFLLAVLATLYIALRLLLGDAGTTAALALEGLHPSDQVVIARVDQQPDPVVIKPPPTSTQLQRIRAALAKQIEEGLIQVDPIGDRITIRVNNLLLFDSGSADVKPEFDDVASRIAAAIDREPGEVFVVGHTDNTRLRITSRFKSNQDLSVKRAQAIADLIGGKIADASRLKVSGKGELQPLADNATADGKRRNRRVEISIPREESFKNRQAAVQ
jgi:type VI secretion system protein ImpK